MFQLKIITSTVRPGRKGPLLARWAHEKTLASGLFQTEILELGEINLPMMNEPNHPVQMKYEHEHTKWWSSKIKEADAFLFVTGEYDYNYPAPLRNALEYLYHEWTYKPAGIISYGGQSAGLRATNGLKLDLSTFKMVPLPETVSFNFYAKFITPEGVFAPGPEADEKLANLLKELLRWTKGLELIRNNKLD
jgi:NAD(P)H-dependent FMN reductase